MSALFGSPGSPSLPPVAPPPPVPTLDTPAVQQAADETRKIRAMAQGRASTYLTDPQAQTSAEPTTQRYLGGSR